MNLRLKSVAVLIILFPVQIDQGALNYISYLPSQPWYIQVLDYISYLRSTMIYLSFELDLIFTESTSTMSRVMYIGSVRAIYISDTLGIVKISRLWTYHKWMSVQCSYIVRDPIKGELDSRFIKLADERDLSHIFFRKRKWIRCFSHIWQYLILFITLS